MKIRVKIVLFVCVLCVCMTIYWFEWTVSSTGKQVKVVEIPPLSIGVGCKAVPKGAKPCLMTTYIGGRLGNQIFNYWTLLSLAKISNCTVYLNPSMAEYLLPLFHLRTPVISPEVYWWTKWTYLMVGEVYTKCPADLSGQNIFVILFIKNFRPFLPFLEDLRRELTFKEELVVKAQQKLWTIKEMKNAETFVSVHARRSDYNVVNFLYRILPTDAHFYSAAMDHFRSAYRKVVFVVVSDDMEWCRANIMNETGDVYFAGDGLIEDPIHDFALLAHCNHSILGQSTFAFSAALIQAGDAVYFDNNFLPGNALNNVWLISDLVLDHYVPIVADLSLIQRFSQPIERLIDLLQHYSVELLFAYMHILSIMKTIFSLFLSIFDNHLRG